MHIYIYIYIYINIYIYTYMSSRLISYIQISKNSPKFVHFFAWPR